MLYQQQRIPLIIDPVGKALVWLEDTLQVAQKTHAHTHTHTHCVMPCSEI